MAAQRIRVKSGSKFEDLYKYSRILKTDGWIYSSNTSGRNFATREMVESAVGQTEQSLKTLRTALAAVDADLGDVVQFGICVAERDDLDDVMTTIARHIDGNDPTHTIHIGPLPQPEMKVELSIIAKVRDKSAADKVLHVTV
ncbi:MAG: RidA family protein [Rhizobiaceae bacterium]|nr:RidA family protein [Rhizobiaceae bacterium]